MVKIPEATPRTKPSSQGLDYLRPADADLSGVGRTVTQVASFHLAQQRRIEAQAEAEAQARQQQTARFKALQDFNGFQMRVDEALFQRKKTAQPDDPLFREQVMLDFNKQEEKFIESLPPEFQEEFRFRAGEVRQGVDNKARAFHYEQQGIYFKAGVDEFANQTKINLGQEPTLDNLVEQKRRLFEVIDATDRTELEKNEWKLEGAADLEKIVYQAAIEGGAAENIDDDPMFANITYEDRLSIRRDAEVNRERKENEAEAAVKENNSRLINDLMVGLDNGSKGQYEIDELIQTGVMTDVDDIRKARTIYEGNAETGKALRDIVDKLSTGRTVDPTSEHDRAGMNAVVGKNGLERLQQKDQDYVTTALVPLVNQANAVPTDVAGLLTGMIRSNDATRQGFALDTLAQLQEQNPDAFDQAFDDRVTSATNVWNVHKGLGGDLKSVLESVRGGVTQEERQARKILKEEAESILTKKSDPNFIDTRELLSDTFSAFWGGKPVSSSLPYAARALEAEFQTLFVDEYQKYGNVDEAANAAVKLLQKNWSVSEIGGQRNVMKYAPEKIYPALFGGHEWMDAQMRQVLDLKPGEKFQLLSDDKTLMELQAHRNDPSAPLPSYKVVRVDAYGLPYPVPGRRRFVVTPEMQAREDTDFGIRLEQAYYDEWVASVYAPAVRLQEIEGTPVPADIEKENTKRRRSIAEKVPPAPVVPIRRGPLTEGIVNE